MNNRNIYDSKEILASECKIGDIIILESHLCKIEDIKYQKDSKNLTTKLLFFGCDIIDNDFYHKRFLSEDKIYLLTKHE